MAIHKMQIEFTSGVSDPFDAAEMVGMTLLDYSAVSAIQVVAADGTELFADSDDEDESEDEDE